MNKDILTHIESSLDDNYISGSEKKALKQVFSEQQFSKQDLDFLRSKIFDLARTKMNTVNMHSIISWLEDMNKLLIKSTSKNETKEAAYFSPGEDCLSSILFELSKASRQVQICVFTISDDRIANKIIDCHRRGVSVKILTDNDKSFDRGSDVDKFVKAGIPVKVDCTRHHMHHKFALIDNKTLITGSFNWTRSATDYNNENILVTESKSIVERYSKEFSKLWSKMEAFI